ncbi:MAG: transcription termination factor Rho [Proteobacteria bacterium]|nr:transcription termination factor Rho [Pseudomonadota bacterium]
MPIPNRYTNNRPPRRGGGRNLPSEIAKLEATTRRLEQQAQQNNNENPPVVDKDRPVVELSALRAMRPDTLVELAEKENIEHVARMHKQDLLFALSKAYARNGSLIKGNGTLQLTPEGYGFLRYSDQSYVAGPGDIYVSPNQVRRYYLRTGDVVSGEVRIPQDNERYFALFQLETVNGEDAIQENRRRTFYENLTPLFPTEQLHLERNLRAEENITGRVIDLIAPIGKGQRGLLVASPKSGKTVILQQIAHAIEENHPDVTLMVLLIDERPEEVTEMKRSVRGEVVSSTFDEPASRHVQVTELVLEKAKRLVEMRKDVVILLDSITRLARAYNTLQPTSGRVLSGGVDSGALQRPKRFFGAARNVEEGGSLTIIATALIETGSKMDEVIYEEFKGTGNMELHLDRRIAERRIYPAITVSKSSTRREELLLSESALKNIWVLRKALAVMDEDKAIEFFLDRLRQTKNNEEFFNLMKKGG